MKRQLLLNNKFEKWLDIPLFTDDTNSYELIYNLGEKGKGHYFKVTATRADGVCITDVGDVSDTGVISYTLATNMYGVEGELTLRVQVLSGDIALTEKMLYARVLKGESGTEDPSTSQPAINTLLTKLGDKADKEALVGQKAPDGGEIFNDYENNIATAEFTHAEGHNNKIITDDRDYSAVWSHIEGDGNTIEGANSGAHAEGAANTLKANIGHVEGMLNEVFEEAEVSHTEGAKNKNSGRYSHIEGIENEVKSGSVGGEHIEGWGNIAKGRAAHSQGYQTQALANDSHSEGCGTVTTEAAEEEPNKGQGQHVQGKYNIQDTEGKYAHVVGNGKSNTQRSNAHTLDWDGNAWFAGEVKVGKEQLPLATQKSLEAVQTTIDIKLKTIDTNLAATDKKLTTTSNSMVGKKTTEGGEVFNSSSKAGEGAHAEGDRSEATGIYSHAEGSDNNKATGQGSHAEGAYTESGGYGTHAEGYHTKAPNGYGAHSEGFYTEANATTSHAEGAYTKTKADSGGNSWGTHAEGYGTIAVGSGQHVEGTYNVEDTESKYLHILGNGSSDTKRSNAHTIDRDGNAWFSGTVEATGIILTSPNGTKYKLTVADDGTLKIV